MTHMRTFGAPCAAPNSNLSFMFAADTRTGITRERAAAQARALSGALALANLAGWKINPSSSLIFAPPFRNYLHVEQAQLLLVPSIEPSRGDLAVVGPCMREARCDALVVKASSEGCRTLYCAIGEWLPLTCSPEIPPV
jgi:hypothetical protein